MEEMDERLAGDISLLFVGMSAVDSTIVNEEVFLLERLSDDYSIPADIWKEKMNEAFITYINEGDKGVRDAVIRLSRELSDETKTDLVCDLYSLALVDELFHEKEEAMLRDVCSLWGVDYNLCTVD